MAFNPAYRADQAEVPGRSYSPATVMPSSGSRAIDGRFELQSLPYPLHTNRELEFMLERNKPLAHFSDAYDGEADELVFPESQFEPYVSSGRFVKRDFVVPDATLASKDFPNLRGIRHLFYAQCHEAWRIDAFITLLTATAKAGWSDGFERLEGSLLGYEEWQIDIHMARRKQRMMADSIRQIRKRAAGGAPRCRDS